MPGCHYCKSLSISGKQVTSRLTLGLSVWKTVDAPRYLIGYNWTIALDLCMLGMLFVLRSFWKREQKVSSG